MDRSTALTVAALVVAFFLFAQAAQNAAAGNHLIAGVEAALGVVVIVAARSL